MTYQHQKSVRRRRRGFRRLLVRALAVSVLLHAALLLLWRVEPAPPPGAGGAPGAASSPSRLPDEAMRVMEVARPAAESEEETGRPVVARLPEAAPVVRDPVPAPNAMSTERVSARPAGSPRLALATGSGGGSNSRQGSGSPGEPGRISPPVPRSLLPQWDPPPEVRGSRVTVHVEVGRDGRPTGEIRLEPPTESEEFNRKLRKTLTSLRYRPGTRSGQPVVAWAEITFVF